jgi:hypothetical protein
MGLNHKNNLTSVTKLKLCQQKIVGIQCGYFHVSILVEHENGDRQIVAWGYDL